MKGINMESNFEIALMKISVNLNKLKIDWAVGASTMLMLREVNISAHDIDVMVGEEHFTIAHQCLSSFCEELYVEPSKNFKSRYFKRYIYNGIEIDLMSGMGIVHELGLFDYHFTKLDIDDYVKLNNESIPLCFVEDWLVFYHLMPNRDKTIKLIEVYFKTHEFNRSRILKLLELLIPNEIRVALKIR